MRSGGKLKAVAVEARRNAITGLEFLEGIPGSIGGALRMNAGAMGAWIFEAVETIRFMDFSGQVHERKASEVYVEYRGCPLFKTHIALGAVLKGESAPQDAIAQRMNALARNAGLPSPLRPAPDAFLRILPLFPPANSLRNSVSREPVSEAPSSRMCMGISS
jgi:UDP-N-acetylenolpyruvoylglucosamine reductase